ncbi:tripartite tricarboxylate transporter TctB family protein [Bradyrhizobium sp. INPA01-394B]|uniref:Tripartite tricarboxylate transporter TctB family protein n=1 Tax=Bradyrhizobium campsiandrae TaxID=1729892 RepID=A0ABR7U998_9BRAD|nr:tripartite tricarboxylate transporter TctB family protein [Bradyrhizobium campsiandrae]MBC9878635.1 tripartite tricarboxylate transporter TctB family protein [Bradyrhizobium campsiandrae]MBC9980636.1 tripartite tricarboxylate transporter TctB family protein [Bradyrhizobium campsiandrae]
MTINRDLVKGLSLLAIALFFGLQANSYPLGTLGRAGPGMFPLVVSALLFLVGSAIVVRTRIVRGDRLEFKARNIALVAAGLLSFVLLSGYVNMLVGLTVMVLISSYAASDFKLSRALALSAVLACVALAMKLGLGLQLPLY